MLFSKIVTVQNFEICKIVQNFEICNMVQNFEICKCKCLGGEDTRERGVRTRRTRREAGGMRTRRTLWVHARRASHVAQAHPTHLAHHMHRRWCSAPSEKAQHRRSALRCATHRPSMHTWMPRVSPCWCLGHACRRVQPARMLRRDLANAAADKVWQVRSLLPTG